MSKMIDGNKLILALSDWWYSSFGLKETEESKAIHKVLDEVEKYVEHEKSAGGWIPCSERLPDVEYGEGDSVLCCTETGLMHILYWNGGNWCVPTGEPHQWINHKTGWHDKVIAWMPLPDPYKEDDKA